MKNKDMPLVSICCLTYNHEPYIRQCLDGFMMQKTDFPFEMLIHDDASTDGTADIIREYKAKHPDIIKPIYQTDNQYSKGVGVSRVYQFPRAKGKYIAMCEGDDYWTDPYKLQKQVDVMEANENFGMIHSNYDVVDKNNNIIRKYNWNWSSGNIFDLFFNYKYAIVTATVLFRTSLYEVHQSELSELLGLKLGCGDAILWMVFAKNAEVKFMPDSTTCYRVLENSASHNTDIEKVYNFTKDSSILRENVAKLYDIKYNKKKCKSSLYRTMIKVAFEKNNYPYAKKYYIRLLKNQITNVFDAKSLLFFLGTKLNLFKKLISKLYMIRLKITF